MQNAIQLQELKQARHVARRLASRVTHLEAAALGW